MRSQFLTLVISALILARARIAIGLAWRGPEPTLGDLAKEKAHMGFTPRPTNGPNLFKDVRGDLKLLKRNIGENTCGYESAVASEYQSNSCDASSILALTRLKPLRSWHYLLARSNMLFLHGGEHLGYGRMLHRPGSFELRLGA